MEQTSNEDLTETSRLISGIDHSPENDSNYKILVSFSSLYEQTNDKILTIMMNKYSKNKHQIKATAVGSSRYWNLLKDFDEATKDLVIDRNQCGWSLKSISSCFGIDIVSVRAILFENKEESMKENIMKKSSNYPYNIMKDHIVAAEYFLTKNATK